MANQTRSKVLQFLIEKAMNKETTTYEEVAAHCDLPTTWPQMGAQLSPILYDVLNWCAKNHWPKMTVLVVRKSGADMGLPGKGFWDVMENLPTPLTRDVKITLTEVWIGEAFRLFEFDDNNVEPEYPIAI